MRRLMFLTQTHTVWGGMEWWVHHLAQRMLDRSWEVYAGLAQGARFSDPHAYAAAHPHLRPVIMDARVGTESARVRAVVRALRQVRPDVVIPVGIGAAFEAIRAVESVFIVPVLSLHEGWLSNVIESQDVIDLTVPNSRLLEKVLAGLDVQRLRYIRQGTPRATVARSPRTQRLRAGIVSRLEEGSKRVLDLVGVAERIGPEIELLVVGDGPDRDALEAQLRGRAQFHGYMPTERLYREVYPNLDVLLFFSPAEGSPNGIYEAMQNGVVPVSSRFAGWDFEKILRDGENALLFDVGDVDRAAQQLHVLAENREVLDRMSIAARRCIMSYTDEDMYDAWIDAIESTTRHTRRGGPRRMQPAGRLERVGVPAAAADAIRRLLGVRFPHGSGWEEWPGSQQANQATTERVTRELAAIERASEQ
jgi:glycosyltransferase involved in cell wall biosynthesis